MATKPKKLPGTGEPFGMWRDGELVTLDPGEPVPRPVVLDDEGNEVNPDTITDDDEEEDS